MPDSYLARVRKLPRAPAPNDRPEDIKGNLSLEMRQLAVNFMRFAIADFPDSDVFGHVFLRDMRLTEIYLRRAAMGGQAELVAEDVSLETLRGAPLEVQLVCELQVRKDMLNLHGVLAGAASAHLIELGTFGPLQIMGFYTDNDAFGVSTNMNLTFHASAGLGTNLRMVGTSLAVSGRTMSARCEIYDKDKGLLLVSAVHTFAPFQAAPKKATKVSNKRSSKL